MKEETKKNESERRKLGAEQSTSAQIRMGASRHLNCSIPCL
jgi:hypothetical protein